jgi:hypothetical protein
MNENFAYSVSEIRQGIFNMPQILRDGTSGFTSDTKQGVLRISVVLKNPSPLPCLNPQHLGPGGKRTNHYTTEASPASQMSAAGYILILYYSSSKQICSLK